jgi:prepilin-type N-terminal cleavage/methylation domain-containing protein
MAKAENQGFTLVEILVVLIITGFIVAILLQALQQVFRLQTHFGHEIFHTQNGAMYADWFRQSINGLMPDNKDGKHKFLGEQKQMRGLTLSPLDVEGGALSPFTWKLEFKAQSGQTGLYYGEGTAREPVLAWAGSNGAFIYVDAENNPHDSWPPFLGKWPQLPRAIYLESGTGEQRRLLVAVPRGPDAPLLRRNDLEEL